MFRSKKTGRFVSKKYARRYPHLSRRIKGLNFKIINSEDYHLESKFRRKNPKLTKRGYKKIKRELNDIKDAEAELIEALPQNYIRLLSWTYKHEPRFFTKPEREKIRKALHLKKPKKILR